MLGLKGYRKSSINTPTGGLISFRHVGRGAEGGGGKGVKETGGLFSEDGVIASP